MMKKNSKKSLHGKILSISLLIISLLTAWYTWLIMNMFVYGEFYIQLFGKPIMYLADKNRLVAYGLCISSLFFFVFLLRIKNYKITKWILFAGIISMLALIAIVAKDILRDQFVFVVMFGCIVLACLSMLVIMFVIKKHLWTKLVLLFVNLCFILSMAYWGISSINPKEDVEQGWKHETVFLQDKNNANRRVYIQIRNDEERHIVSEKITLGVYKYHTMGGEDNTEWIAPKDNYGKNKIISTYAELLNEVKSRKDATLLINGDISVSDKVFLENAENITLIGFGENEVDKFSINANAILLLKACKNIRLENLNINIPIRFENCNSITIQNCNFSKEALTHLYFDDECQDINIESCMFSNYSTYAIDIPINSINILGNSFYSGNDEESYDYIYRINLRGEIKPYKLDNFYGNIFGSSYSFSSNNEYEYSDVCEIGTLVDHITDTHISWTFGVFLKEDIQIKDYDINELILLKLLSGGISPVLNQPVNKKYIQNEEEPRFQYCNPLFLDWWRDNMIPFLSEKKMFNIDFQLMYNRAFRYHAHAFIESYLYLHQNFDLESEVEWYLEASVDNWEFADNLRNRYTFETLSMDFLNNSNWENSLDLEYLESQLGKVVGFWIRRYIDGTDEQIFDIAKEVIQDYDPDFYEWIENGEFEYAKERGDIVQMKNAIREYVTSEELEFISNVIKDYSLIASDQEMATFYETKANEVSSIIQDAMFSYAEKNELEDYSELDYVWGNLINGIIPFIHVIHDNEVDGPSAYVYYEALLAKSKSTEGESDDLFFDALYSCYGSYQSVYVTNLNEYDGGGYSHTKLGNGNHIEVLRKIVNAKAASNLFKKDLEDFVTRVMCFEQEYLFGYSKDKVYDELNKIIELQDNTDLDFTQAIELKARLDTATVGVHYNCETEDCYQYLNE